MAEDPLTPPTNWEKYRQRLWTIFQSPGQLVVRPPEVIANLPPRYRWEFTRRHPYYLIAWEEVGRRRRGEPEDNPIEAITALVGEAALLAIGVSGKPADPALEFDDPAFGGNDPFVISGACQPVTLRALAILLIQALPPADRAAVGAILQSSGIQEYRGAPTDQSSRDRGADQLRQLPSDALNSYPLWPLFHIHLDSSQRTILEDVTNQVRLRQQGRSPDRATRPEILDSYLDVWDQREGWTGSGYSLRETRRFVQIAGARAGRRQISTAFDRYCRAFELVVGQAYSFDRWYGLFGFLKLNRYLGNPDDGKCKGVAHYERGNRMQETEEWESESLMPRRPQRSRGALLSDFPDGYNATDLLADLRSFLDAGHSDEEIAARLGVSNLHFIADIRDHWTASRDSNS